MHKERPIEQMTYVKKHLTRTSVVASCSTNNNICFVFLELIMYYNGQHIYIITVSVANMVI